MWLRGSVGAHPACPGSASCRSGTPGLLPGGTGGLSTRRRCPLPAPPGWGPGWAPPMSSPSRKTASGTGGGRGTCQGGSTPSPCPPTQLCPSPHLLVRGCAWHSSILLLLLLGVAFYGMRGAQGEGGAGRCPRILPVAFGFHGNHVGLEVIGEVIRGGRCVGDAAWGDGGLGGVAWGPFTLVPTDGSGYPLAAGGWELLSGSRRVARTRWASIRGSSRLKIAGLGAQRG